MVSTSGTVRFARFALGIVASLGLGWLATRGLNWDEVLRALKGLPPHLLAAALLLFLLSNLARAYRWRLLFLKEGITIPRLFLVENMGLGLNNMLPVRVASEAIQFALLTLRDRIGRGTALATLGMTRVMDIWATTMLLALGLLFVHGTGQFVGYAVGGLIFSLLLLALVRFLAWGSLGLPLVKRVPLLSTFASSVAELEGRRGRLLASLAVSVVHWLLLGASGWVVARGMGIPLGLPQVLLVILVTIFFATSIPSFPLALGTFEAAVTYLMGLFDVDRNLAFPYALVMHGLLFLPPTLLAVVFLPREGIGSLRWLRSSAQGWKERSSPEQA